MVSGSARHAPVLAASPVGGCLAQRVQCLRQVISFQRVVSGRFGERGGDCPLARNRIAVGGGSRGWAIPSSMLARYGGPGWTWLPRRWQTDPTRTAPETWLIATA